VRHVRFGSFRLGGWVLAALAATGLQLWFWPRLLQGYQGGLEGLLNLARVPFERGAPESFGFVSIPCWSVASFNPVALWPGALAYGAAGLLLALVVWRLPRIPYPLAAWLSLIGVMVLICTAVLAVRPVPHFTPEAFSGLWMKVTVATTVILPWVWAFLVGVLPLPIPRVAFWGLAAWVIFVVWSLVRLAFFLALARAVGVIWLPMMYMLGGTLQDCFAFIVVFSQVLVPAGREWEEPA
jgi:hypothetical protein